MVNMGLTVRDKAKGLAEFLLSFIQVKREVLPISQ
jgi:hypothetical protein